MLDFRDIICRLCLLPDLPLSHAFVTAHPDCASDMIDAHLSDVLQREPGVFLERYGHLLLLEELDVFSGFAGYV